LAVFAEDGSKAQFGTPTLPAKELTKSESLSLKEKQDMKETSVTGLIRLL
jgi:hypothetical protein